MGSRHSLPVQRGYTKLFNTIVTSTIWQEDDKTRIVWITMLAIADQYGIVSAAVPGLASVANVSVDATRAAIKSLLSVDPDSRTKDFDGRRIEEIDGGWRILNYDKYRRMLNEEERKEYQAKWVRQKRRQKSTHVEKVSICSSASPSSFLEELKRNHLYAEVEFDRELEKAKQWCKRNNRRLTERFFTNWLNKADRVLLPQPKVQKPQPARWSEFLAQNYPEAKEKDYWRISDDVKREFKEWNEKV